MSNTTTDEAQYDPQQVKYMNEEDCILVDGTDKIIGRASKKEAHLMENINKGMLHRAFSTFLFDKNGRLLLQQRASEKITFPDCWTNTCCSHPLFTAKGDEIDGVQGVKIAVQRKLEHELNIDPAQVPLEKMKFLTRIWYKAPSDGKWGEHEMDYIVFIKNDNIGTLRPNPNEVSDYKYVSQQELQEMIQQSAQGKLKLTPWFALITDGFLFPWWEKVLSDYDSLPENEEKIHNLTKD